MSEVGICWSGHTLCRTALRRLLVHVDVGTNAEEAEGRRACNASGAGGGGSEFDDMLDLLQHF